MNLLTSLEIFKKTVDFMSEHTDNSGKETSFRNKNRQL